MIWLFILAGALSEREAHSGADLNAELEELRAWKANAEITLAEDLSHIRKLEGMVAELRIRIFKAQALAYKPGAHKEHVLAALDPDA